MSEFIGPSELRVTTKADWCAPVSLYRDATIRALEAEAMARLSDIVVAHGRRSGAIIAAIERERALRALRAMRDRWNS